MVEVQLQVTNTCSTVKKMALFQLRYHKLKNKKKDSGLKKRGIVVV